ncbi:zinc-dependent peptidase [Eleftheria terrae]|uniref:M90 family metallopeptidase n=1 Tax=Eleftheria terrae TaxID=1597781 RepID=UPI00263AE75B|nr:M90 family metallopeptidase [Eleftheria terrae]WKB52865.1 zinc-dependent peptidase [Eleftheria terrae]
MFDWLHRWRRRQEERVLRERAIPDLLWQYTLACHPFLARRSEADLAELRRLTTLFLANKEFSGAGGFVITDEVAVAIAAQACVPILKLGLALYDRFVGIVVHSDQMVIRREEMDEHGVVHEYEDVLVGETAAGAVPVTLSWYDVAHADEAGEPGYNVVIHEFVHKIDLLDGEADGVPPLTPRSRRDAWAAMIDDEYLRFCARVDRGEDVFLDPYAAEAVDEFFAVSAEAFFVAPDEFRLEHPRLYTELQGLFLQDPAAY